MQNLVKFYHDGLEAYGEGIESFFANHGAKLGWGLVIALLAWFAVFCLGLAYADWVPSGVGSLFILAVGFFSGAGLHSKYKDDPNKDNRHLGLWFLGGIGWLILLLLPAVAGALARDFLPPSFGGWWFGFCACIALYASPLAVGWWAGRKKRQITDA